MPSIATSNLNASAARNAWHAALLGSVLAGCAGLGSESAQSSAAPPAGAKPTEVPGSAPAQAGGSAAAPAAPAAVAETPAKPNPAAVPAPTSGEKPVLGAEEGARIEGFLSSRLVERWTSGDHDLDWINLLSLDYSDPRHAWIKAHVVARASADLDGRQSGSIYNGLSDTHDQSVDFKLYEAFVDILPADGLGQLRIGRQFEYDTPEIVHYDGLSFRSHPTGDREFTAGFYGGVPVRLYQGTSDSRSVLGAFAEERPWKGGRARIDWMHLEDDTVPDEGNGIIGLGLWQHFDNGWAGEAQYTRLEDQDRDLRMRAQWTSADAGFTAAANYYQLFESQNQLPADIDPYTELLMALFPYRQFGFSASAEVSQKIVLDLALDARRVDDAGDLGEFNRDWERYRATATFRDVLAAHLNVGISGDVWDGDERDITTWGLDLNYDTLEQWKFGAGSYYSLYKYDLFQNSERDDVRTWYARAGWKIGPKLTLELSYDYEDDAQDQYNVVRGGAVWHF